MKISVFVNFLKFVGIYHKNLFPLKYYAKSFMTSSSPFNCTILYNNSIYFYFPLNSRPHFHFHSCLSCQLVVFMEKFTMFSPNKHSQLGIESKKMKKIFFSLIFHEMPFSLRRVKSLFLFILLSFLSSVGKRVKTWAEGNYESYS